MAELAAAGAAAQFLGSGLAQAVDVGKEVKTYMVDVLTRSLDRFDYEKVFVEGIVCTAIFAVIKIVYWIYSQIWLLQYTITHPTATGIKGLLEGPLSWFSPIVLFASYFTHIFISDEVPEEEKVTLEAERKKDWFLYYGKAPFEDYWVPIILGIWAIFVLMEKRRVDLEHRKRKLLMRMVAR